MARRRRGVIIRKIAPPVGWSFLGREMAVSVDNAQELASATLPGVQVAPVYGRSGKARRGSGQFHAMEVLTSEEMAESTWTPKASRNEFQCFDVRHAQRGVSLLHTCEADG